MYKQVLDPVGDSLFLTAIFAALPVITLFILLGGLKFKAHWAALISLGVAIVVALIADDQRIQAVIIAFSFGALMEALAGFGTPVAIAAPMLVAIGFRPLQAASLALVANTAPVAFGAIATPIITLGGVTGLNVDDLGAMVGRQTPFLALVVPLVLVGMVDGMRGVRQVWPAALAGGLAFAVGQFACSNFLTVELTDIVASLLSAAAIVALLRVWHPAEPLRSEARFARPAIAGAEAYNPTHQAEVRRRSDEHHDSRRDVILAYAPYLIIIAVLSLAQWSPIKDFLEGRTAEIDWPGLNVLNAKGEEPKPSTFIFNWLATPGTLLLISGLITMLVLRLSPARALRVYGKTL